MARITDIIALKERGFSLEILPPMRYSDVGAFNAHIDAMIKLASFVSATYHQQIMDEVQQEGGRIELHPRKIRGNPDLISALYTGRYPDIPIAPHFICGGFSKLETESALIQLPFAGIENVILLRGDPNHGDIFKPHAYGHKYASGLVEQVAGMRKNIYINPPTNGAQPIDFCIGVATHPESHYASRNIQEDIITLKRKEDAGANFAITQMCFDSNLILEFIAMARAAGILIPIIPGIKILDSKEQLGGEKGLPARFNIKMPNELCNLVDDKGVQYAGIEWGIKQAEILYSAGINNIHFYTQNKPKSIIPVLEGLGFKK